MYSLKFGKYKNINIEEVPTSYLTWILHNVLDLEDSDLLEIVKEWRTRVDRRDIEYEFPWEESVGDYRW